MDPPGSLQDLAVVCKDIFEFGPAGCDVRGRKDADVAERDEDADQGVPVEEGADVPEEAGDGGVGVGCCVGVLRDDIVSNVDSTYFLMKKHWTHHDSHCKVKDFTPLVVRSA